MRHSGTGGFGPKSRRRWIFADCVFDEASLSLFVGGSRVAVEAKPLELLRLLLLRAGDVVSKHELLDTIWPKVTVVEASLPTAVRKLRLALGGNRRERAIIETVAGIGYRLAVPVSVEDSPDPIALSSSAVISATATEARLRPRFSRSPWLAVVAALLVAGAIAAAKLWPTPDLQHQSSLDAAKRQQLAAIRRLDITFVERLLAAGWDPNTVYDSDRNTSLNLALEICEWDPDHDPHDLLFLARTLIDGGARLDRRNAWGDTPYSIAKENRYCGPNHPVTKMIRARCYAGGQAPGDRCLADYHRDPAGSIVRQ